MNTLRLILVGCMLSATAAFADSYRVFNSDGSEAQVWHGDTSSGYRIYDSTGTYLGRARRTENGPGDLKLYDTKGNFLGRVKQDRSTATTRRQ